VFTGIIEELGRVERAGVRLEVSCRLVLEDMQPGASIAVNGVCLTAAEVRPGSFLSDVSPETLERSNLGDLRVGARVNLERPLAPSGRLGGHLVQGHVDAVGDFLGLDELGDGAYWLKVRVPPEVERYVVLKGSIAIDGVSLTVAGLEGDVVAVAMIPHTFRMTAFGDRRPGDRVNLECDLLAKYVEKLLAPREKLTVDKLREMGY
jgi:riboflavin synthase